MILQTVRKISCFSLFIPALFAAESALYTVENNVSPWYDRVGQWVVVDLPELYVGKTIVPLQGCSSRSLVLPAGTKKAIIAIAKGDLAKMKSRISDIVETGLECRVTTPAGKNPIPYVILEYLNPPEKSEFKNFSAGLILLSLDPPLVMPEKKALPSSPALKESAKSEVQGAQRRQGVLAVEETIEGQSWQFSPGPREIKLHVKEPSAGIGPETGIMLVLHNWGGLYNSPEYISWCKIFADRYDVVAVSVNYLQSGSNRKGGPYDHGYLQAMDAIRAVHSIWSQLKEKKVSFNENRIYSMGESGGGNVSQMAAKLAPRTFACIVDICGMPGLTDGIAFGTGEYGSHLNAGYSRDPNSPFYLSKAMQEIRDFGNPAHCEIVHKLNPNLKIVIAHGVDDRSCPVVHKITQFRSMVDTGIDVDGHFLTKFDVDGAAVTTTGHPVGNRAQVVIKYADVYLSPTGKFAAQTKTGPDFGKSSVVYPVTGGKYIVDYSSLPEIRFDADPALR
ncbi:MAG: DUF2920 family protein [Candidatus Ratteibacteria bacterium]|jgi:hypothetical protein